MLNQHPLLFAGVAFAWVGMVSLAILRLPLQFAALLSFLVMLVHALCGACWLWRMGPIGIVLAIREAAHAYLGGIDNNLDCPVRRVGGSEDHVHILCRFGRTITVADLVKELKRESSKWLKAKSPELSDFFWQNGYGAFSVSPTHVEMLRKYIAN